MHAAAPSDRHRLVLACLGWAGLRRNELWSLLVGDVNLSMGRPSVLATRKGGRRQELPIARAVANALRSHCLGRSQTERIYPGASRTIHADVRALGTPLGIVVAPLDRRRTFGRILYYEKGVDINEIRSLYGHAATEMTLYYIGAVSDRMMAAVERFDDPRPRLLAPIPDGV